MKKATRFALPLLAAASLLPAIAGATIVTSDRFPYNNGTALVGQGGWQAHSGAGAKTVTVNNGSITVQQSSGSGEDVNKRWFTALPNNAKTYFSINFSLANGAVIGTGTDYFVHFRPAPPDTNGFVARVYVGPGADATHYSVGISATSSGTSPVVLYPTQLEVGTTHKVVAAYDAVTGTSTLWVDPTLETDTNVSSTHASVVGKPLESIAFRQASPVGATYSEVVGDVRVGTTFADVTGQPKEVPSLSQWGMMVLASLILAGGFYAIRRRATAVA